MLSLFSLQSIAQSFKQLWDDVEKAVTTDKPQTMIAHLQNIINKAEKEKAYGHLMKAELMVIQAKNAISPDSLAPAFLRLVEKAGQQKKYLPQAVYNTVIGKMLYANSQLAKNTNLTYEVFFDRALADPVALSKTKATGYEPLVKAGLNGDIYDHDLLSVIAHEAKRLEVMRDCYNKQPKRKRAALMATLETLEKEVQYNYYRKWENNEVVAKLDSVINKYGDIPECCEAAILRYRAMDHCKDITDAQKYDYLTQSIARWGNYERSAYLKNELEEMTNPVIKVVQGYEYVLPGKPKLVKLPEIKGVGHLKVEITKVNIGKETQYSLSEGVYKRMIKDYGVPGSHKVLIDKDYPAHAPHEVFSDSIWIEGMPAGVYLIDYITDNPQLETIHNYFHVTDIALLMQALPNRDVRLAVVNSTTGQPMPDAHIDIKEKYAQKDPKMLTVACNPFGEYVAKGVGTGKKFFAYTDTDWGYREQEMKGGFFYDGKVREDQFYNLFTDRSIYRPGQTVSVAVIAVDNIDGITTTALVNKGIELELVNPQGKTIESKKVATDNYGTAHAHFVLPEKMLSGAYAVKVGGDYVSFRVEEYKRPTFYIEIEKPNTVYQCGDTLTVIGKAMGYNGVPVQGAKVSYKVDCSRVLFWWRSFSNGDGKTTVAEEETITAHDGTFMMRVPLKVPFAMGRYDYYRMIIDAQVTDQGGESQRGECSLPLSARAKMMYVDIPKRIERDSLKTVTFSVVNAMGQPVDETVTYAITPIDNTKGSAIEGVVKANKPITLFSDKSKGFESGAYLLTAICGNDTVKQQFVVFDIKDTRPAIKTHDWFYVSSEEFPTDGRPVSVQVGTSDANAHLLYTVTTGEKVLEMGHFDLSNEVRTMTFNYNEEYQEGISVAVCWVKDTIFHQHQAVISRPLPKKELKMEWATFRDKLTPGQKETWTLRVRQANGKPAGAQVMATLYDKSLDQLKGHQWAFDHRLKQHTPFTQWNMGYIYDISDIERPKLEKVNVSDLRFDKIDDMNFIGIEEQEILYLGAAPRESRIRTRGQFSIEESETPAAGVSSGEGLSVRENLNETAFFYPALVTDANGMVALRFTLPEALTTWRFMGLAHDKNMNTALIEAEAIATKTVMVQPNIPRFIRHHDAATITSRIVNTSSNTVTGIATLELLDPATEKIVFATQQSYTIPPKGTSTVVHNLSALTQDGKSIVGVRPLICRVIAEGRGYSDGEQHYLPILPDVEQITNTRVITQHHPGEERVDLTKLFVNNRLADVLPSTLTVEYAENPAWMMVQTLPTLAQDPADNAISIAASAYAQSVGGWLINASPVIRSTITEWKKQQGSSQEKSLVSELQKNEQLKSLLLEETPWALDAENETARIQQLADYLDSEQLSEKLQSSVERLKKLQLANGGFSWMNGMSSSVYTTTAVAHILSRQQAMTGGGKELAQLLERTMGYLAEIADREVAYMKTYEKDHGKPLQPSEFLIDYLYIRAINGHVADGNIRYVVERLKNITGDLTIYGKATAAVVLATYGERDKAIEFLESMIEYSVFTEEMGRYFDTKKAYSSWFDYKIPTSVACIEAMKMVDPKNNEKYIEEMQRWLLQEKRTQAWDTPVNTVNAVHAFLKDNLKSLQPVDVPTQITVDGKPLEVTATVAGLGYVNTTVDGGNKKSLHVKKSSEGTSWGAIYAQYYQSVDRIAAVSEGISLKRDVVSVNGKKVSAADGQKGWNLKVGDRVVIRLTIDADRDYDFVQITDKRASCMEPVNQLSGYHRGCYVSPTDHSTNYFYDQMRKGHHEIETEYYIDRVGTYQSGAATLQCVYAPAFSARDKAILFNVK